MNNFNQLTEALARKTSVVSQRSFSTPRAAQHNTKERGSYIQSILGKTKQLAKRAGSSIGSFTKAAGKVLIDPEHARHELENKHIIPKVFHQITKARDFKPYRTNRNLTNSQENSQVVLIPDPYRMYRSGAKDVSVPDPNNSGNTLIGDFISQKYINGQRYVVLQIK